MSRILLAGVGPLPPEDPERLFGPGLRAWIFAETLARAGHEVDAAIAGFGGSDAARLRHLRISAEGHAGAPPIRTIGELSGGTNAECLARIAASHRSEAIVALTDVMGEAAARAGTGLPLWFDFLGSPMAERQQQAAAHGHDGGLADQWRRILPCLLAGDRFSTCSEAQRLALIGELGACGRLNRLTAAEELVHVILPGAAFSTILPLDPPLRGRIVPKESFVALWAGGFNTWTDVRTLHAGLGAAMDRNTSLHFISFGGAIPGHCEMVYPEFEQLVAGGRHRERFHLMGWVEPAIAQGAYLEADLGINIDCQSYEGILGTRSRLLEWMKAGLPIITTPLCELAATLSRRELAYSFPVGDAGALAEEILRAASEPRARKERAVRAAKLLEEEFRHETLLAPLLRWTRHPRRSPDLLPAGDDRPFPMPDNPLAKTQLALWEPDRLPEALARLRVEGERRRAALSRLLGSRAVRLFMRLKGWPPEEA